MENEVNYCAVQPMTYEERYEMYMTQTKEKLASMLAHRDIIDEITKQPYVYGTLRTDNTCNSWSDCTNPCKDCINCPLRNGESGGGYTVTATTLS